MGYESFVNRFPPSGAAFSFPLVCRAKRRARQPTTGSALATVV
ncbi:hypothetical protein LNP17_00160 [Klebsiella variicola subsp. variicola]|nr:hypothetical protein [Escherichia coli]MCS5879954.1 hypothetical protein [Klebsiella variicola subsp. variicola]MCS5933264.1 hypothetical protein [Klebsiella variicola subsp. variicola]